VGGRGMGKKDGVGENGRKGEADESKLVGKGEQRKRERKAGWREKRVRRIKGRWKGSWGRKAIVG